LAAALLLGACARHPTAPAYPFSAAAPRVFVATPEGLAALPPKAEVSSLAKLNGPAALVPSASVLSANGSSIMVAVNRVGPVFIEPDTDSRHYRLRVFQSPEPFARLTTGGAWPRDGGFLVQLYHDPFSLPKASSGGALGTLLSIDAMGKIQVLASSGLVSETPSGFGLFALYPSPQGGWLAELRRDEPDKVETRYLAAADPEDPAPKQLKRSAFESALEPQSLAEAAGATGEALRHALAALVASEGGPSWSSALIRVRGPNGGDRYYLDGGSVDEARSLFAWFLDDGRAMVMEQGGEAAISDSSGASVTLAFAPPVASASFTGLAVCRDLAAASWESGTFPDLRAAGLVVAAVP
jgi:hypothetical protein